MGYSSKLVDDYFRRRHIPHEAHLDAFYSYELSLLRDMLDRLEVILDDEGVPRDVAVRVLRCLLYGSPSAVAAEMRMAQEKEIIRLMEQPADVHQWLRTQGIEPPLGEEQKHGDKASE